MIYSVNTLIKIFIAFSLLVLLASCSSTTRYTEYKSIEGNLIETGIASWYGPNFHGKRTANGEIYNMNEYTAAHKTLPFDTILRVTNKQNNKSVIVRINDRGPYVKSRIIDLSRKAAEEIDMIRDGSTEVSLYLLSNINMPKNIKKESFTVQIGSFRRLRDAERLSNQVPKSRIFKVKLNGDDFYRVFSGIFSTKTEAEKHLYYLKDNGFNGFVKQVEN